MVDGRLIGSGRGISVSAHNVMLTERMRKSFVYGSDTAENKLGNPHFIKLLAKDKELTKLRTSALAISFIDHMVIERMGVDPIWVAAFCEEQRSRPAKVHHPLTDLLLGLLRKFKVSTLAHTQI